MNEKLFRAIMVNVFTAVVCLAPCGVVVAGLYRLARLILGLGCG